MKSFIHKNISLLFKKFPLSYLMIKSDTNKPLYKCFEYYLLILLIGFTIAKFELSVNTIVIFSEFIIILFYYFLLVSINNKILEFKESGFYNKILMTNQNAVQIYISYTLSSSFRLLFVIIVFVLVNSILRYFITYSILDSFLFILSNLFTFTIVSSLGILLANFIKISGIISFLFAIVIFNVGINDIGLMKILLGLVNTFSYKMDFGRMDDYFIYIEGDNILLLNDVSIYITLFIQAIFASILVISTIKQFESVRPLNIKNSYCWYIMILFLIFSFIILYFPQISFFKGSRIFNNIYTENEGNHLFITYDGQEYKAILQFKNHGVYGISNYIITDNTINHFDFSTKQKEVLVSIKDKEYQNPSELSKELFEKQIFSSTEIRNIIRKSINYHREPYKSKNIDDLINQIYHDKLIKEEYSSEIDSLLKTIKDKSEGYIYSEKEINNTFVWIIILSNLLLLTSYYYMFTGISTEFVYSGKFRLAMNLLLFIIVQFFGYYLMLRIGKKQIDINYYINQLKSLWEVFYYFPLMTLMGFLRKFYTQKTTTRLIMNTNFMIIIVSIGSYFNFTKEISYSEYFLPTVLLLGTLMTLLLYVRGFIKTKNYAV